MPMPRLVELRKMLSKIARPVKLELQMALSATASISPSLVAVVEILLHYIEVRAGRSEFSVSYRNAAPNLCNDIRGQTIDNNLQAGSEGCAPTPSQYLALTVSILMSLNGLPSPFGGGLGMGSYVPLRLLR